ncbi:signal transduction histidine kinase [Sphingomonas jejuensis]|uniref:histidine kinase n=1 Tax=Sphingomonas jejuensis TaxID=904715 RepID=A0ABX0XKW4_9SPHN|nr:PAS domain-containing sensor histidine kinase [Sphingomonas jejuensis]NJC33421.1 signal transduction histidine kinase [Sphingomonas jejuensis]
MIVLSPVLAVAAGVILALWLTAGAAMLVRGRRLREEALQARRRGDRLLELIDTAPAAPLVVHADGGLEAPLRLMAWLGLDEVPATLSGLSADDRGLQVADLAALADDIASARVTARPFTRAVKVRGSSRTLLVRGAAGVFSDGQPSDVLLWFFDMTESQTEIAQLREEGARLSRAFDALSGLIEASPIPMWHRGPDLRLTLVNSAYVRAVEAEDAQDVVRRGLELIETAGSKGPLAMAAAARESRRISSRTVPATIAGERRMFNIVDVPLGDAGVAGYAIDIDAQEQARLALDRFVMAQRDTLDRLSAGVVQFGPDRTLLFCNQPFQRLFALRPEWLAERPEFDRVLERMREAGRLPEVRDFRGWRDERRGWFTSPDGGTEEHWTLPGGAHFRVVAQPLPDGGLIVIFEDQTEQLALASARDTLLRVRAATFDNLFEGIGVFAADGRLQLWNSKFRDIWEFDEELLATHPRVDRLAEAASQRLSNPSRAAILRELVRVATTDRKQRAGRVALKNGSHFEFAAVPLPDGNALFTMLDITDSRRIEAALRDRNEALEAADKVKTAFVANMSYELRTPLTSIGGFAEMLAGGYAGDLSGQAADYVEAILESVSRLGSLIDSVLDLTQSAAGSLPIESSSIDLARLCRDAAEQVRTLADERSISLQVDLPASLGRFDGDARRLRQAFDNLVENAVRYTQVGGRVEVRGHGDDKEVVLTVSDNGPGMNSAEQAQAFDRFGRAESDRDDGMSSLGLGLPLARQFVEAHGGTLTMTSEVGTGTAVTVTLPRR